MGEKGIWAASKKASPSRTNLPASILLLLDVRDRAPSQRKTRNSHFSPFFLGITVQGQHRQDKHVALCAPTHAHTHTHATSNAHTHMGRICTRVWIFPKRIAVHAHQLLPAYMGLSQASAASSRSEPRASPATDEYHTVQPQASAAS